MGWVGVINIMGHRKVNTVPRSTADATVPAGVGVVFEIGEGGPFGEIGIGQAKIVGTHLVDGISYKENSEFEKEPALAVTQHKQK